MTSDYRPSNGDDDLLDSWKAIARHLRRTVRTVQRWEKTEGLPIHRHEHLDRPTVYAFRREIDSWQRSRDGLAGNAGRRGGRRWWILAATSAILVAVAAAVLSRHTSPNAIAGAPVHQDPRWVLITDFENRTGDSRLDGALEFALQRELTGSPVLRAVPLARVLDTLRLMERPMDSAIDPNVGREICLRDGDIPLLTRGRVDHLGSSYSIDIQLIDSASGSVEAAAREERLAESELLPAIDRLARQVRAAATDLVADSTLPERPPPRVTTDSLRALQLYARADRIFVEGNLRQLVDGGPSKRSDVADRLLREAVRVDPGFASAHALLGWAVVRETRDRERALAHMERAQLLAERAGVAERLFIEGSVASLKGDEEAAISNYEALLEIDPTHFWASNNLIYHYYRVRRFADLAQVWMRLANDLPNNLQIQSQAATEIANILGIEEAWPFVERARSLAIGEPAELHVLVEARLAALPGWKAWLENDPERAASLVEALSGRCEALTTGDERDALAWEAWRLAAALGQRDADRWKLLLSDAKSRQMMELWTASLSRDREVFLETLASLLASLEEEERLPAGMPGILIAVANFGLVEEAERLLAERGSPAWKEWVEPFVQLRRGLLNEAATGLERLVAQPRSGYHALYFLAVESLAELRESEGDTAGALRILEEAAAKRSAAAGSAAGRHWVRNQALLAERYRRRGRPDRAATIEAELRRLLILADHDPLLGALSTTETPTPIPTS